MAGTRWFVPKDVWPSSGKSKRELGPALESKGMLNASPPGNSRRELDTARRLGFVLLPQFSLLTLSAAWEGFRLANSQTGAATYVCQTVGVTGREVRSSNDIIVKTDKEVADDPSFDITFVISSLNSAEFRDQRLEVWLQAQAAKGKLLAPIGSAAVLLARIGLLNGYRCVTHWKHHEQFLERFPRVRLSRGLYCVDRERLTAAGGLSALDLGLSIISRGLGSTLAKQVADEALLARLRSDNEAQRMDTKIRYEVTEPRLIRALEMMEANLERPLSLTQIASASAVSERQLERLFAKYMKKRPLKVYSEIRLQYARELVKSTTESISRIAAACGFSDGSHLCRQYRAAFGEPPTLTRQKSSESGHSAASEDN
uniref:Transcriptional regulator, AraC family with amidase-like domain n=1 Tax=Chelativorans sp. (strain BNC1) TaxID=266779 RepID=Q11BU0_CHESB